MKLYRVIIPVSNIELATEFYQKILSMEGNRVSDGRHYFDCGGTILACFDPKADGDEFDARQNPDHIYLSTANLDEILTNIKNWDASLIVDPINTQPWGEKTLYAKDPFGNPLCFVDEKTVFKG
ncbi:VOC family protein [Bacillus luteolus]|uniref:VOC family protein n=1 Tax=Litchfieldia luteola TaxID=682179 RepID=A0ABR9QGQ0_9BACI|nr:VOC family protein [Cytobacillus luteolus]MBE4907660.1 VOC family protein [Cytobacillus luteolus]MBP1941111.1 catechol 2,3-dioxygenase-like lactoylglutathione lyase family enzyme [Cytobacillus luteolus]